MNLSVSLSLPNDYYLHLNVFPSNLKETCKFGFSFFLKKMNQTRKMQTFWLATHKLHPFLMMRKVHDQVSSHLFHH